MKSDEMLIIAKELLADGPQSVRSIVAEYRKRHGDVNREGKDDADIYPEDAAHAEDFLSVLGCTPVFDTDAQKSAYEYLSANGDLDAIENGWELYDSIRYQAPLGFEKIELFGRTAA